MGLRDWPYWLKGMIVSLSVLAILFLLMFFIAFVTNSGWGAIGAIIYGVFAIIPFVVIGIIGGFLYSKFEKIANPFLRWCSFILTLLLLIALLAVIVFLVIYYGVID